MLSIGCIGYCAAGDRFQQIAATEKCQDLRSSSEARMDEGCVENP